MGLYIETHIRTDLDDLWARTQDPAQHQRWDLRFIEIDHLPRAEGEPQRFRYAARVLPFLKVSGTGVTAGETERPDGTRTSALRFVSPHPLSLLAEGSGYWRYVPDAQGVRFLTGYDYRPRWGAFGALADRLLFRPLTGWATAWSFDRLRLWLERASPRAGPGQLAGRAGGARAGAHGVPGRSGAGVRHPRLRPVRGHRGLPVPAAADGRASLALLKAPLACTPAARRCLRTPVTHARAPASWPPWRSTGDRERAARRHLRP
ncbi:hypothetical protein O1M54_16735 [Streptomyces diastatochromogenes]|nr:hypothetical protein [Streptomyces diastatochromogenes]